MLVVARGLGEIRKRGGHVVEGVRNVQTTGILGETVGFIYYAKTRRIEGFSRETPVHRSAGVSAIRFEQFVAAAETSVEFTCVGKAFTGRKLSRG